MKGFFVSRGVAEAIAKLIEEVNKNKLPSETKAKLRENIGKLKRRASSST